MDEDPVLISPSQLLSIGKFIKRPNHYVQSKKPLFVMQEGEVKTVILSIEKYRQLLRSVYGMKIHIKNQLNDAQTIEFCLGEKEYELKHNESVTVLVKDEDCLYLDIVKKEN